MNPNEAPQQAWWLNIDQMLQSLSTNVTPTSLVVETISSPAVIDTSSVSWISENAVPPVEQSIPAFTVPAATEQIETPSISPVLEPTFSIDALTKPMPGVDNFQPVTKSKPKLRLSHAAGMMASVFGTLAVLVIGGWVYSVQYPIATEDFLNSITGLFNSTTSTTQKNLEPDTLVITDTSSWDDQMHSAAPDEYMLDTPLSDALLQSQSDNTAPNSTEQMLDTVVWSNNNQMTWSSGAIPVSQPIGMSLPSVNMTSAEAKQKLLTLSQSAEEAMTNLVGNSDSKLALMRVVYKNSQAMLTELMADDTMLDDKFIEQLNSLQALYDKAIQ